MPPWPNPIPYCLSARMLDYFSPSEVNPPWAHAARAVRRTGALAAPMRASSVAQTMAGTRAQGEKDFALK
jgi:hypothetical protein